ncbi:cilia- and flagella-associated protein 65 [Centroberyx affinis]|uniref:cilia- and flagella-associated protein 65 n=1 Tax=Centroberyx affinis TaxID=166261 RepID=UPI003A5BCA7B
MLAGARGPLPLGPASPWTSTTCGKDVKCPTLQHPGRLQRPGELQRRVSSQRSCFLGVELWPELVWEDWELGRDFTKTLVLKNVHSKLQKLRFRPPVSKFFTTLFPQLIVLSPGTSFSMPVTFRPLQRCEYEDSIEFQGKDGSFQVCLRATIPCHALEVPESVLLPLCAVQHSSRTTFLFRNASKLLTCFQWECPAPFQLSPERGLLKPGQECRITVVFRPQEALVYQQEACCRFGEEGEEAESRCTVLLQGIAKYPCLQLGNPDSKEEEEQGRPVLHFGSVAVDYSVQKHIDILNPSPVTASFSLSRLLDGVPLLGSEFSCDITRGEVAPGASLRATVTYTPIVVDNVSVEYLSLTCPGALSKPLLKLTGNCIGPTVSLSSSVMDFGCVEEGGTVVRTVELVNSSPADAVYQWDLDCSGHSVFSIQPAGGTLPPHSHTILKVVYRPTHPMAHHRRVSCLILHKDPMFLDLIGTCHSELQQPAILRPKHLVLYQQGALCSLEEELDQGPEGAIVTESSPMEEYYQACSGGMDLLSSSSSSSSSLSLPHVTVEPTELLFNHRPSSSSSSSQSVSITNHTGGKLSLVWTAAQDSPFSVSPSSCDLGQLKSTSFRVTYAPQQLNTLHGAQLECFAFYKDHRQMEERLLRPPWCVTVRVIGHSFQPGREHFIPRCSLQHPRVVFPALSVLSYRTVLFQNSGELPLTFHLDPDQSPNPSLAASVFVVPSCGLIRPGDHQILTLRTTPTEDSPEQGFSLSLQLNAAKHTQELTVVSTVEKVCVSLEGDGSLYFQPTAVGSRTQRSHRIRNLSRLPLRFQWKIPGPDQELLFVEPEAGELQPNESTVQTWSFSPLEETTYTLKSHLTFWPIQTPGCKESHLALKVMGMGSKGSIEAENAVLDLGELLVGSCRSIEVPLVNNSLCPVSFSLSVQQTLLDKGLIYDPNTEPNALQLDSVRGTIASHSRMLLRSTVRPHRRTRYQWTISYQTLNASGFVSSPAQKVCEVQGEGVFPTLQVIDACSGGSVGGLSKVQLWNLFSLDGLNEHLLSSPSPPELTYRTPTRHSVSRCPSIFTTVMLDFNFSAAPLSSDPSTVVLMFHNTGPIPVDWAFLFPEDQQIELEYWAETGEFSSTELHQMKVQDNRLFSISPRSGTLLPGQQRAVHFSYRHDFAGMDRLPVLFKLSHGREILLNFQGVTVERDRPYLHYASSWHVFTPVTIGGFTPPRQVYELYNGGAVPVRYEVDTAPLKQLQADNFNQPVMSCLNPQGEVLPGKTAILEWVFSPLEATMYNVDIPIHIQGGDSMLVRFEGCGFDSRALGSSNPFHFSDAQPSVPCVQRVPLPGQVVFLSEERVSLGDIPVCSRSTRILFLTNVSQTDTVYYAWELPQQKNQHVVQMHPERGSLCPGESALCVLTLTSSGYPTFYQLDLICQVTHKAALAQYHDALRLWEEERERQQHEFTLTENDLSDSQGLPVDKEPVAAPVRNGPPLRKYKTLPPIRASSSSAIGGPPCTRLTRAERRAQREAAAVWRRPEPPHPALLHLGLTARSHGLLEYHTHFPNQLNKHYVHRSKTQRPETASFSTSTPLSAGLPPLTDRPKRDILTHTLTSLLRSLLDDPTFHQSLVSGVSEPVPYFSQLRETTQHSPLPSSPYVASSPSLQHIHPMSSSSAPPSRPQLLSGVAEVGVREQRGTVGGVGSSGWSSDFIFDLCEDVLLNTLQNLMMEAFLGELVLTAHPRTIVLPPVSARRASCVPRRTSRAMAEEERKRV